MREGEGDGTEQDRGGDLRAVVISSVQTYVFEFRHTPTTYILHKSHIHILPSTSTHLLCRKLIENLF